VLLCVLQSLHSLGFRVVLDVVYNHTFASGPYSTNSVMDKIVPGYYHRRQEDGEICHSTCCNSEQQGERGGAGVCMLSRRARAARDMNAVQGLVVVVDLLLLFVSYRS